MKISREVKTAILVILGIILMLFLFNYLKGINLLDDNRRFHTTFDYNALNSSSPVTIRGNNIGKIEEITYDAKTGKTKVTIIIGDDDLKFSTNSKIRMYETGLMGGNALAIVPIEGPTIAKDGDYLQSEIEEGLVTSLTKNFSGISSNLGVTLKSADSLLTNLNLLVADQSENGLKTTIAELNSTIISFRNLSSSFNSLVAKNDAELSSAIKNFNTISTDLTAFTSDLKTVELSKSVATLDKTLNDLNALMANIENGNGSLGKLMKEDKLYNNLEGASKQLEQLLQDFKLNPKRYIHFSVFGKKPKQFDAEGNEIEDEKTQPESEK